MAFRVQTFRPWLNEPVDGRVIGLFRLIFGLFMVYDTIFYIRIRFIPEGLLQPKLLFKFDGFGWVGLLPEPVMYVILAIMGLSAALIAAGVLFRWACWVFSLCLTYFFLQEVSYYNNHIYLFILLPLLLSATDADRFFSLRSNNRPFDAVPRWQQVVLQAQIVIVYFFAGIVKFKADWLVHKEPMTMMIHQFPDAKWIAPLIKHEFVIDLFTYGGFLMDLLTPILLWYKPIRNWAWIPFALFHLTNSQVFDDIGIFPFVMLAALILFFDADEIPFLRKRRRSEAAKPGGKRQAAAVASPPLLPVTRPLTRQVLIAYFAFQLIFPFRGFFLPNPMDYTNIGNRFSWRVKSDMRKIEEIKFTIQSPQGADIYAVDLGPFLNPMQIRTLTTDPRAVAALARFLREEAVRRGLPGVLVKARIRFSYNGRPVQFFVDPEVDLASAPYSPFRKLDWVAPLADW